jgi:uncharacterized protein
MNNCKIEWIEIPAPELQKAKHFYETVFGWKVSQFADDYLIFESGNMHGGFYKKLQVTQSGIRFSITVDSIEETMKVIEQTGGKQTIDKFLIGEGLGYCAGFSDPNGNTLELWAEK